MRIRAITVQNFRSFEHATIELPTRIGFLIARNGRGKSSGIDAVQLALAGHCRGTDARGVGAETLIRSGAAGVAAPSMSVDLDVEHHGSTFRITRRQTGRTSYLSVDGVVGTREASGALQERLGVSTAVIDACLQSGVFFDLSHQDFKALLLEVLAVKVSIGSESLTLAQVDSKYQRAFEDRKARKAALHAIATPPAPAETEIPDVATLERKLSALRDEEGQLIASTSEASGRRSEIERQLRSLSETIARQVDREKTLAVASGLDGARLDLDDALVEAEERLAKLTPTEAEEEQYQRQRNGLIDAEGRLKMLAEMTSAVEAHSPDRGCVLNGAIPCKTPAKAFVGELANLRDQVATLQTQHDDITKACERRRLLNTDLAQLADRVRTLKNQADVYASVMREKAENVNTRVRLEAERDACPADAGASPQLVAVRERIANGERVIRQARELATAAAAHAEAKERQRAASTALGEAERAVELYGPNGARVKALEAAIGAFHARINQALARFGYQIRIIPDPWTVLVNDRPAALLSASERLQVGIALQLAIATVTGFGFVAIDQVDLFDGPNRAALGELLDLATEVQVLAAATKDDTWVPPPIPGWTWIRLVNLDGVSSIESISENANLVPA